MSNIVAVLIVRCTHTGFYKDGRQNTASVTLYDLDEITIQKNRTRAVPVPPNSSVDIPMSTRTFISYHEGAICKHVKNGELTAEIILQLRDKGHCGGPAGTGQALRPAVLNIERVANELRLVIPNNTLPTILDSVGFLVGEPLTITGLTGAFRNLNGQYVIKTASPGDGLAGADAASYLVVVDSVGPDIAAATLAGANLCLTEGRVTSQFGSNGDVGGLGDNVFGYVGGLLLPHAPGGGGAALSVLDEGILVDAATTSLDFVGAGVTATTSGPGVVTVTIPGGGGGAPTGAEYVVLSLDGTLTDERVLTAGTGIAIVDSGPNAPVTISVDATWAEILANGNVSGGTNPTISTGDSIVGVTDLILNPGAGAGDNIILDGLTWPGADGSSGEALITNGAGVLSFGPAIPAAHAPTHIAGGTDEVDGDRVDIDFSPTNYTPDTTPPQVTLTNELTAHLAGIDNALASVGADGTGVLQWGNASVASSLAVRYLDPGFENRLAPLSPISLRVPRAGRLRNLHVRHNSPGGTGATITYTVRVNGVASIVTIGVASTATSGADTTNSIVVAQGDYVDIEVTKAATAGGAAIQPEVTVEVAT